MVFILRTLFVVLLILATLPLFWLAWLGLLATRVWSSFKSPTVPPKFSPLPAREDRLASIVILNWNGRHLLEENLPSVVRAARHGAARNEVLVVDNGSVDGSVSFLRDRFPEVRVIALSENRGFGEGNNIGVSKASHPVVVILNNDMSVEPNFLELLLEGFEEDVFAVSSQIDFKDARRAREETGKTTATFANGWFQYAHQEITGADLRRRYVPVFWAGGGSSAFHRQKFLWLGGFDSLYSPCYVEDTDLSIRAWKLGWKVLLAPASCVHHQHRASSSRRYKPLVLENLILRNQILFAWVNLFDWRHLRSHGLLFPFSLAKTLLQNPSPGWWSLPWALLRWPAVLWRRLTRPKPVHSDSDIFQSIEERFRWYCATQSQLPGAVPDRLRILMVTAYLPHLGYHAGAGRMFHLIRRLAARHEVSVISFLESEAERDRAEPLQTFCRSVRVLLRQPDYIRSLYAYEPFDAFYSGQMRRLILRALEEEDYDVLHFEYAQMGHYFLENCPIPQILTQHEVNFAACRLQACIRRSWLQKFSWYYNYMQVLDRELRLSQKMARIICMTENDALCLAGLLDPERLAVIRTGVDLDYFAPSTLPEEENSLLFVGSFQHYPNSDAMIHFCGKVFPRVLREVPTAHLYIVGAGPSGEVTRLSENGAITVTGFVTDLRPHLARAALFIVPLRLGVGIRGKILEAWAMERPVIATQLACSGFPVEHGQNAWVADSDEDFAAGIVRLLADIPLRRRLGRQGRLAAEEQFSWDRAARQLEHLYYQVITTAESPRSQIEGQGFSALSA